jgi:predicted dehydrogenase
MTHRIGVLGLHHDHVWGNLEELQLTGRAEIVGAADPHRELLDKFQDQFGGPVFESYDELLDQDGLTAVYIFGNNKISEDLTVKACDRGLHCLVEKPMASTLEGAEKMLEAANRNQVRFMINWPFVWWPQLRYAIDLAQSGRIGKIWEVKYRAAHQGPVELGCSSYFCEWLYDKELNGAGALMDYCCYGAVLCQVLLGSPDSVLGAGLNTGTKPDLSLEDNAILILKYPDALGVTEASWTQIGKLTAYNTTIYGSGGTLYLEPDYGGKIWLATGEDPDGNPLDLPDSPSHLENASTHFLAAIEDPGLQIHPLCDAENCCGAQSILQLGIDRIHADS